MNNEFSFQTNPQYCIDFVGGQQPQAAAQAGQTFVAWVVVTKLQLVHSDGFNEDVESSKDYIALHVYNNPNNRDRKVT